MLVDEFLPEFDVSDEIQTTVAADVATTWRTLIEADLIDVGKRRPLVAMLGGCESCPRLSGSYCTGNVQAAHRTG